MSDVLLEVQDLRKHYPFTKGVLLSRAVAQVKAVDGISFSLEAGQTIGIVGESGCGKSTSAKIVLNLEKPTSGQVLLEGEPVHEMTGKQLRDYRSRVQAVFQDPWSSLNPRMTVGRIIGEALVVNRWGSRAKIEDRVHELLVQVGLREEHAGHYPHEFSGGQRQRVALASALASFPKLIVLDEPVSALDVSIRAQMMNLLKDIQKRDNVAYLLIAHDLATVRYMADHVAVMYLGRIVEYGPTKELIGNIQHPYTRALFAAVLPHHPDETHADAATIDGEVPSPLNPPSGCHFHPRCPLAVAECRQIDPVLRQTKAGHWVACHLAE